MICSATRRPRSARTVAFGITAFVGAVVFLQPVPVAAQTNFKLAFYNIQSGNGEPALSGHVTPFTANGNCTDTTLPLNAWGVGFVQKILVNEVGNDPSIVALGLAESWPSVCGSPSRVRAALGWKAVSDSKNGLAIVARYGFAGPLTFTQYDTSLSTDTEARFIGHAPVCLDAACTASYDVFIAHWAAAGTYRWDVYERIAKQSVAFMQTYAGARPRTMLGDLNVYDTSVAPCATSPVPSRVFDQMRNAGYVDAWRALYGSAEGFTGMVNRVGCAVTGMPAGYPYKRIDYAWMFDSKPSAMKRFARPTAPGEAAASDHYGIIVELPRSSEPTPDVTAPSVSITSPASGATVSGLVSVTANAADAGGVARVEFLADGASIGTDSVAPFQASLDTLKLPNGSHSLQARAYDVAGNMATSGALTVSVANVVSQPPPSTTTTIDEVVIHAATATVAGTWRLVADATAADGKRVWNPNLGAAKPTTALAAPSNFVEMTFSAEKGKDYRLWIRGKADSDHWTNDSAYVQFSDSVDATGVAKWRIGTTSSTTFTLEDASGAGLMGWGWQDNGYGLGVLGATVRFAQTGKHTIRIQTREDGLSIDQVVLSAAKYISRSPGATKNDTTILAVPSARDIVLYASAARVTGTDWRVQADTSAASGALLVMPNAARAKVSAALASPASYAELTFTAEAGREYRLWIRGRAQGDSWANDSVYVQFSDSVDVSGAAMWRIGTTSSTTYQVEEAVSAGLQGWGWQDNGYGTVGTTVRFAQTGTHTIRIQNREDGLSIDQVVLSSMEYLTASPGTTKNDTTILVP